jgi:hypothetical protein
LPVQGGQLSKRTRIFDISREMEDVHIQWAMQGHRANGVRRLRLIAKRRRAMDVEQGPVHPRQLGILAERLSQIVDGPRRMFADEGLAISEEQRLPRTGIQFGSIILALASSPDRPTA